MKAEEIEKAAIEYTSNLRGELNKEMAASWFIIGAMYSNTNWQEKTRWKSLLDEPPKLPEPFEEPQVVVRGGISGDYAIKLDYDIKLLVSQNSINYWLKEGFTHWKKIE